MTRSCWPPARRPGRSRCRAPICPACPTCAAWGESEAIQVAAEKAQHVLIVGAGWIGSEVAASLRELGAEVALVAPERTPLERVLGPEGSEVFADLQPEHGIKQHFSTGITRIEGTTRATGSAHRLR